MPRTKRILPEEGYVHVMCRGNNKQMIFHDAGDLKYYYDLLVSKKDENLIEVNHYCLMNNHIHLMVHLSEGSTLSRYMKQVNLAYFGFYKNKYSYVGHLYQGRYKSSIIDRDSYLIQCGKYIEMNPVRAGYVDCPESYKYSSYKYYAFGQKDELVTASPEYNRFGKIYSERQKTYMDFVVDEDVKEKLGTKLFIGAEEFIEKLEKNFSVKNIPQKRGRPRKIEVNNEK